MKVLAVDLGATSVRVSAVDLDAPRPRVEVLHRWEHGPVGHGDGSLRWDWNGIVGHVLTGLGAGLAAGPVASIGIDGWGVDYGLVGADGSLVAPPFSYRDRRTSGWREVAERIGAERLYRLTGIQLMAINTIFQLGAHLPGEIDAARQLLLLPDLMVRELTGHVAAERSNASTTGLLDARTGDWSHQLIEAAGIDPDLLPPATAAGTPAGMWHGVPVHLVGSHDTASAFLAMPASGEDTVFVSSGTWVLVGVERPDVDTSAQAAIANFSNEAGAFGGYRFLKNVMGFWMLEECRRRWGDPPIETLLAEAAEAGPVEPFDASGDRFLAPADMEAEVRAASGIAATASRGVVVAGIVESIAAGVAGVVDEIGAIVGAPPRRLALVGGGARNTLLRQALARRTGLPVLTGAPEATTVGNALAQGIALGRFAGVDGARRWVEEGVDQ